MPLSINGKYIFKKEIKGIIVEYTILPIKSTHIFFLRGVPKPIRHTISMKVVMVFVYTTDIV